MGAAGLFLVPLLLLAGLAVAEALFWSMNGRAFWRAMVPQEVRRAVYPGDPVRLDPYMALQEWTALLFLGACLTLPLIALETMGFTFFFA